MGSVTPPREIERVILASLSRAYDTTLREDVLKFVMSKIQVVNELWLFMREHKKFWLAPIVITLALVGLLLVIAKSSAIAPFIYTLF
jgi:hypothetical protein